MAVNVGTVPVYPDGSNEAQTGWTQAHVMNALEKVFYEMGFNSGTQKNGVPQASYILDVIKLVNGILLIVLKIIGMKLPNLIIVIVVKSGLHVEVVQFLKLLKKLDVFM